jgi:hypothetical protein
MLSQPFLFTASTDDRKQVRDLLNRFARLVAKENGLDDKACTCHVRKFVNRQSKPKMMTAYKQFMIDNSAEINEKTNSFTEFNEEKTRRWNAVKEDKDQLAEYERRATEFNEEHNLLKKKKKRALTGYMLFSNEQRPLIKEEEPSLTLSEVSKRIGKLWNSLAKNDKDSWVKKSKELASCSEETTETVEETTPKATKAKKASSKTKKTKKSKE